MTHVHTHEGYRALLMFFGIVFSPVALHEFRGFADSLRLGGVLGAMGGLRRSLSFGWYLNRSSRRLGSPAFIAFSYVVF